MNDALVEKFHLHNKGGMRLPNGYSLVDEAITKQLLSREFEHFRRPFLRFQDSGLAGLLGWTFRRTLLLICISIAKILRSYCRTPYNHTSVIVQLAANQKMLLRVRITAGKTMTKDR